MRNNGNQFLNRKRKQVEEEEKNKYEDEEINSSEENEYLNDISGKDQENMEEFEEENSSIDQYLLINKKHLQNSKFKFEN